MSRVGFVFALTLIGCTDRPTTSQCHEAIVSFMILQLPKDLGSDGAVIAGSLAGGPNDEFDSKCHREATPAQVKCLGASRTMADVKACVVDEKDWEWLQPLLRIAYEGERH